MYTVDNWTALARGKAQPARVVADGATAELVEFKERDSDRYGEYYQGEAECHIIFKVGERYFKKTGEQSSYGDEIDWSYGQVTEVFPKTKTVQVFE